MKKLASAIVVILVTFLVLSLGLYRRQTGKIFRPQPGLGRGAMEIKIVSGTVSGVDEEHHTLVLDEDGESLVIAFDDRTAVTEIDSGEAISADSIVAGDQATVKYTEGAGSRRAGAISISSRVRRNQ